MLHKDLKIIINDLTDLKKYRFHNNKYNSIVIENPVRFKYLISYANLYIEEIFYSLITILKNQQFLQQLEDELGQLQIQINLLVE